MKKLLLAIGIVLSLGFMAPVETAHAQTRCDNLAISGLPDAAVIELKKKCVEIADKATAPVATVSEIGEYAELGKKYGIALSEVAKSVGITVNELAQTPVGKFMLVMVAYRVMGEDLIGIIGGFIWFSVMLPLWTYLFHRIVLSTRHIHETYNAEGKLTRRELEKIRWTEAAGVLAFWLLVVLLFICGAGFLMVFG